MVKGNGFKKRIRDRKSHTQASLIRCLFIQVIAKKIEI
jgi:hypothetical protein